MKRTENECVDCGKPCIGDACPYRHVERHYCDSCGEEDKLYLYNDEELCLLCLLDKLERVRCIKAYGKRALKAIQLSNG